jgi:MFS family permease
MPVCLFTGILISLFFVPSIADKYGRRNIYCTTLAMGLFAQLCVILCDNYTMGKAAFFLIGLSWPGKYLVGLMYILEFYP